MDKTTYELLVSVGNEIIYLESENIKKLRQFKIDFNNAVHSKHLTFKDYFFVISKINYIKGPYEKEYPIFSHISSEET